MAAPSDHYHDSHDNSTVPPHVFKLAAFTRLGPASARSGTDVGQELRAFISAGAVMG
jgi:hypothetical protein